MNHQIESDDIERLSSWSNYFIKSLQRANRVATWPSVNRVGLHS